MPNSKQANKRMTQDEIQRVHNKKIRTQMRSAVKKVLQAETPEAAKEALPLAMKKVDKAAKTNVIHQNAANRKKTQLSRAISK